jgi:hypothetical protein
MNGSDENQNISNMIGLIMATQKICFVIDSKYATQQISDK